MTGLAVENAEGPSGAPSANRPSETTCYQDRLRLLTSPDLQLEPFWSVSAATLQGADGQRFRSWYQDAKFRDLSPEIDRGVFRHGPFHQAIDVDEDGRLTFVRGQNDREPHTTLEISVNRDPTRGSFVRYGDFRSMRLGVPYEIRLTVAAIGENWWRDVPWAVVFQGHAIPDQPKIGQAYNPPFALVISRGAWQIHIRADDRRILPSDRSYQRFDRIVLGAVEDGVPVTVVVRAIWDFRSSGALAIWHDDTLVHSDAGRANFYRIETDNDEFLGPYLTFGLYLPLSETVTRTAVTKFTEVAVAGGRWPEIDECVPPADTGLSKLNAEKGK